MLIPNSKIKPMVRAKGLSVGEYRIVDRLEVLFAKAEEPEHSITIKRWARSHGDSSELLKACEWYGEQVQLGYTELTFEATDDTLTFTASKPE